MPMYLIERDIPGAGQSSAQDHQDISTRSCEVLRELGPGITWRQSYVTADRITCVYEADNEGLVREHGARGGFPVTRVTEIAAVLHPGLARTT